MLTREQFDSLDVGDHVETFSIFPRMTEEPVVLQTTQVGLDRREFTATFCGVTLGVWTCSVDKQGGLKWAL
ncbi:hypothetical protein [Nitratireductor sp. OM-1]|uniref:hypothetical protein n=1 Tax=Nitratireductor sp. OM-1 TaxID=1756988 RepID=UPI000DDCE528|nr:hypothetical protein [Nitratireductor sp. OM-1]